MPSVSQILNHDEVHMRLGVEERPSGFRKVGAELVLWFRTLASAAVYAALIVTFGFQVARVEGRSMEPTLHDQDRLIVNKLAYHVNDPKVGDVVMVLHPSNPDQSLVKRVVAAPGGNVAFRAGVLVRNGVVATEGFIPADHRSFEDRPAIVVPEGFYFVLGDHRNNSSDSRTFGPVPKKYILGRIDVRWWPIADARSFDP
jgi:signal peptidase I